MTGALVLLAALVVAVSFGVYRRRVDGRAQPVSRPAGIDATRLTPELGARATFVQFSSEFCAPCRSTAAVLGGLAEVDSGVRHVELDAAANLELVNELGITRTPTVLVLDAAGVIRHRILGAARPAEMLRVLHELAAGPEPAQQTR